MRNVQRYFKPGQICFVTHVTYERKPLLIDHFDILWQSFESQRRAVNYRLIAWVVLPDHWHALIDPIANDMASLMKKIKLSFSSSYRKESCQRSIKLWQHRYWDHIIRDQEDLNRHVDYIHYNPVKHGYVNKPLDYRYSSFGEYFDKGVYGPDWGVANGIDTSGEFGE
jgi:putative transposase